MDDAVRTKISVKEELNMSGNIDLLLGKLRSDSLAYSLVKLLKEIPKEDWPWILDEKIRKELGEKKQEISNAQNQKP